MSGVPYVNLTDSSRAPIVGLGTWQGDTKTPTEKIVPGIELALDLGYRLIDTAQAYKSEEGVGQGLKSAFEKGKISRSDVFVTTKVWPTHHRRSDVVRFLRKSLENLQLDYVDLYLVHWPCSLKPAEHEEGMENPVYADEIDYLEAWQGMEDAVDLGLTKNIGVSNFNKRQLERLLDNCRIEPVNLQVEVSLFFQNSCLVDFCRSKGISVTGFRNLQHISVKSEPGAPNLDVVKDIAKQHGKTIQQVALKFQVQRGIMIIPKSSDVNRLRQNLELFDFDLTDAEMEALRNLDTNKRSLDFLFTGSKYYPFHDPY